ncbi:Ulp1-like peptidase [Cucumis melo var. makuwa]|uniref:Ulp1-like peptidase n=1 Tax=Cucumis melo var. makuwa TaxID=1194695 RepID=A0A5D3CSE1_CUCMM|nr:Ulp1-like peptidase [Cucumis melo var. makuwa]
MVVPSDKYFPATVSSQVHKIGNLIKDKLTKEQLQMFNKIIFGSLLNVNMVFNGQLIHHFLLRQIPEDETVMVGKDKETHFDMDILGRVDDEEAFKSFDWSTFFYTRLLNSLKTSLQGKKEAYELKKTTNFKAVAYYNIKGYVLAFRCGLMKYSQLQKNIFDNKNLSTQERAFMESRIRGDDNMQMEDDESIRDINNNDTNTHDNAMNNKSLNQSDSSPKLSPQRKQIQTVAD